LSIIRRRSVYDSGSTMKDALLDGIDEAPHFVEGTHGLSPAEVMISVVCGMAEIYDDRQIARKGGSV
jgi:hypothetical protein